MEYLKADYNREKRLVFSISFKKLQKALGLTIISFSTLNFLDVVTTLYTLQNID